MHFEDERHISADCGYIEDGILMGTFEEEGANSLHDGNLP